MELTGQLKLFVDYLRSSLRLQAPEVETDPAYQFTDDELLMILQVVTPTHNPQMTIETLPFDQFNFVVLLAKKEVYYRLATSTAPFYPLSAEGASLEKNVRFDHYMALIKVILDEYNALTGKDGGDNATVDGILETYETTVFGKPYAQRMYELSTAPEVTLTISGITPKTVNVEWGKFSGRRFASYTLYVHTYPIVDEYADRPIRADLSPVAFYNDIHKTRTRVTDLQPDTEYFVAMKVMTRDGMTGYHETSFRTSANSVITTMMTQRMVSEIETVRN